MKRRAEKELTSLNYKDTEQEESTSTSAVPQSPSESDLNQRKIATIRRQVGSSTDASTDTTSTPPKVSFGFGNVKATTTVPMFSFGNTTETKPTESKPSNDTSQNKINENEDNKSTSATTEVVKPSEEEPKSDQKTEDKSEDKTEEDTKTTESSEKEKTFEINKDKSDTGDKFVLHSKPIFSSGIFGSSFSKTSEGESAPSTSTFSGFSTFGSGASNLMSFASVKKTTDAGFSDNSSTLGDFTVTEEPVSLNMDKVETKTGDEEDENLFTVTTKCYVLDKDDYKERGIGELKVNKIVVGDKVTIRLLMRLEKTQKLVVNNIIDSKTDRSIQNDKFVRITCLGNEIVTYLFKVRNASDAQQLIAAIDTHCKNE